MQAAVAPGASTFRAQKPSRALLVAGGLVVIAGEAVLFVVWRLVLFLIAMGKAMTILIYGTGKKTMRQWVLEAMERPVVTDQELDEMERSPAQCGQPKPSIVPTAWLTKERGGESYRF